MRLGGRLFQGVLRQCGGFDWRRLGMRRGREGR
jgi:hypothetical protein